MNRQNNFFFSLAPAAQIVFFVRPFLKIMLKKIAVILAAAAVVTASAQTATNQLVPPPPKYPWNSTAGAGLTLTRGNSDTLLVTANIETDKKTPKNEFDLGADGSYGEANSVENVDTLHGFGQYNYLFSDGFFGYVRVEALHDGIADLQYRITVGPGAGYYFIKETNTTLAGEIGSSFVTQRLGGMDTSYDTLRLAERYEYKFANYGARFWQSVEVSPQVDRFDNYQVIAEIGIEAAITKAVGLKTFVQDNFNNEPAANHQKNDVKLVSGISVKF
jgi:putative salt-induced outer membrane protein YdiY